MFERCLYFNVNSLARALNRIWDQAYAHLDLTGPQAYVLRAILTHYGLNHRVLAKTLNLEKSTVTRIVDQLVAKEYAARVPDESNDARQVKIAPTPKAVKLHADIENIETRLYHRLQGMLGKQVLSETVADIRHIQQALSLESDEK